MKPTEKVKENRRAKEDFDAGVRQNTKRLRDEGGEDERVRVAPNVGSHPKPRRRKKQRWRRSDERRRHQKRWSRNDRKNKK